MPGGGRPWLDAFFWTSGVSPTRPGRMTTWKTRPTNVMAMRRLLSVNELGRCAQFCNFLPPPLLGSLARHKLASGCPASPGRCSSGACQFILPRGVVLDASGRAELRAGWCDAARAACA